MTFSVRSDSAGNYGALQVGGADKLILNSDGSLVATTDPATGVRSHALATMQKFADEFGSSLAANGYQKLPSGLIIQWGNFTSSGSADVDVTYPVAFPTMSPKVLLSHDNYAGSSASASVFASAGTVTTSGFKGGAYTTNTAARVAATVAWMAIGY